MPSSSATSTIGTTPLHWIRDMTSVTLKIMLALTIMLYFESLLLSSLAG